MFRKFIKIEKKAIMKSFKLYCFWFEFEIFLSYFCWSSWRGTF
jgi:hypothetical protein